jgi:hypothetical protein
MHIYWKVFWDKVVADEAHFEVTLTSETIQLFKTNLRHKSGSWQTPFWVVICSDDRLNWDSWNKWLNWAAEILFVVRKEAHCAKLSLCTVFSLHQMRKMHDCIVAEKETDQISRTDTSDYWLMYLKPSDSNRVQHNFFSLTTSWLRLLSTLIMLSIVHYSLGTMNLWTLLMIITDQLKKEHAVAKVNWVDNSHIGSELSINVNNWMMKVQQLRVLSSFSQLRELDDIKSLVFSDVENWERNWVHMKRDSCMSLKNAVSTRNTLWTYAQRTIVQRSKPSTTELKNETKTKDSVLLHEPYKCTHSVLSMFNSAIYSQATTTTTVGHQIRQLLTCNSISDLC